MEGNRVEEVKTIIIGAGISGISASVKLLDHHYKDFLVLEAENRIGGRCFTIDYGDGILEYGAQFIHGQLDNPIYHIAKQNKLIDEQYNEILHESDDELLEHNAIKINIAKDESTDEYHANQYFLTQYGTKVPFKISNVLYNALNNAVRQGEAFGLNETLEEDMSLGKFLYQKYIDIVEGELKEELSDNAKSKELRKLINGFFIWRCKLENLENGCANVYDLSLLNFCRFDELKGSQIMEPIYGYKSIIDRILLQHRNDFDTRLRLNHSLKKILLCSRLLNDNKDCSHCVHTNDSNKIVLIVEHESGDKIFVCDNLICTMSLGCLKHNLSGLIEPNEFIPKEKLDSVAKFGFGTINKIFLEYDKPYWGESLKNAEGINLIWLPESEDFLMEELSHHSSAKKWYENLGIFEVATNNPSILIGWMSGDEAYENLDEETIKTELTKLLRLFTGNPDFPEPKSILRSTWKSNKHFRGSYSHFPLGSDLSHIQQLAEPIILNNKLFICFAGEHTHPTNFSTVHGAYLTGIREAERILNMAKS